MDLFGTRTPNDLSLNKKEEQDRTGFSGFGHCEIHFRIASRTRALGREEQIKEDIEIPLPYTQLLALSVNKHRSCSADHVSSSCLNYHYPTEYEIKVSTESC